MKATLLFPRFEKSWPAGRDEVNVIGEIVKRNVILAGATRPYVSFQNWSMHGLLAGIAQMTVMRIHPQSVVRANYVVDQGRVYISNITHDDIISSDD